MNFDNQYNTRRVYETEVTGFSNLRKQMSLSQIWLSHFGCPFSAGFFISVLIIDLMGNVLGFPILTGFLVEFAEEADFLSTSLAYAIIAQVIILMISVYFVYHSEKTVWAYLLGTLSGISISIIIFALGGIFVGKASYFLQLSEQNTQIIIFRRIELMVLLFAIIASGIVIFRVIISKGSVRRELFYRVISLESDPDTEVVYDFDFTRTTIPLSYVYIDQNITSKTIILCQNFQNRFFIENPANRLPFSAKDYMVFNLRSFQNRIGQSATDLQDDGAFFQFSIRYLTNSRSFETLRTSFENLEKSGLERGAVIFMVQHVFRNEDTRSLLDKILFKSVNEFVDQEKDPSKPTAQDFRDAQMQISSEANRAALKMLGKTVQTLQAGQFYPALPQSSIMGTEHLESRIDQFKLLRDEQFQSWQIIRNKTRQARESLPEIFHRNFHTYLSNEMNVQISSESQMTIDCLIACSGLHIMVDSIQIHDGPAMESEKYFENSEKTHIEMIDSMDARFSELSFQALTEESHRNHEIRLQIIKVLEGVMPYCLSADRQSVDAVIDRIFNLAGGSGKIQHEVLTQNIDHLQLDTKSKDINSDMEDVNSFDQNGTNHENHDMPENVSNDKNNEFFSF